MRIGFEIKRLNNLIEHQLRSAQAISEINQLTSAHGYIIGYLRRNEDKEIFQRDIEKEFMISRPTVSGVLSLMEKNELIERRSVERDARLKRIMLTDKARALHDHVRQDFDSIESKLAAMLDKEELVQFEKTVNKLVMKLNERQQEDL